MVKHPQSHYMVHIIISKLSNSNSNLWHCVNLSQLLKDQMWISRGNAFEGVCGKAHLDLHWTSSTTGVFVAKRG